MSYQPRAFSTGDHWVAPIFSEKRPSVFAAPFGRRNSAIKRGIAVVFVQNAAAKARFDDARSPSIPFVKAPQPINERPLALRVFVDAKDLSDKVGLISVRIAQGRPNTFGFVPFWATARNLANAGFMQRQSRNFIRADTVVRTA